MTVSIGVKGWRRTDEVQPLLLLMHYLREVCGSRAANDATRPLAARLASARGELHPVQAAFRAEDAPLCGFCTPS